MSRSMLNCKGFENSFWVEEVNIVISSLNMNVMKAMEGKTPKEAYNGSKKPLVAHFKVFGSE